MGVEGAITVYIFCGGEFFSDGIKNIPPYDFVIAADSGIYAALALGITPDLFIGDFDSFDKSRLSPEQKNLVDSINTMTYPAKKDLTDSMLALDIAVEKGADRIVVYGALGGRLDHTLSNVFYLKNLYKRGVSVTVDNGKNAVRYIENCTISVKKRYKYISLLAFGGDASGVYISGVEYPLKDAVLKFDYPYAVSNEIINDACVISVKDGGILVVESDE